MAVNALSKQKAVALTRAAQVSLALLVVGAGSAMAVWARSGEPAPVPGKLELPEVDLGLSKPAARTRAEVDPSATAARLMAVSNHPTAVEVVKTDPGPAAPTIQTNDVRYLGAVGMGDLRVALVSENGKQRFLSQGDSLAGGPVQSITDSELKIGGATPRTITLAARSGDVVSHTGAARPGGVMGAMPPQAGRPLQPYQPMAAAPTEESQQMRAKNRIPDYIAQGEEQDFLSVKEDIRASGEKFESEDQLNEAASKRFEEKRGGASPQMQKFRKEQALQRNLPK